MRFKLYPPTLAVIASIFFLIGLWNFDFIIASIFFLMPFEWTGSFAVNPADNNQYGTIVRLIQLAFLGGGLAFLVLVLKKKLKLVPQRSVLHLLFFVFSALLSALLINYFRVYQVYLYLLISIAIFFIVSQTVKERHLALLEKVILASTLLSIAYGLFQFVADVTGFSYQITGLLPWYSGQGKFLSFPRIQSFSREPLYYGSFLLIPISLFYSKYLSEKNNKSANKYLLVTVAASLALFLTLSRGAIAAAVVMVFLISIYYRIELMKKIKTLLIAAVIVLAIGFTFIAGAAMLKNESPVVLINKYVNQLVVEVFKGRQQSVANRTTNRERGLTAFLENPFFGVGIGGVGPWYAEYPPSAPKNWFVTLNMTIELLAETGLFGFILFWVFIIGLYRSAFRALGKASDSTKAWLVACLATYAAFWVQYQSFSYFFLTHVWMILGLIAALVAMINKEKEFGWSFSIGTIKRLLNKKSP